MAVIADLHIHSRFSRACSSQLTVQNLEKWARVKGVSLLGTGDFTHPVWLAELKQELKEDGSGILKTASGFPFILTGEVCLRFTQGRGRGVHLVILAPNFGTVDKINAYFDGKGRRDYDGRPIFKISCEQFAGDMAGISDEIEVIPAHLWTPFFGAFGSESGFDSLKEAFGRNVSRIHAIETGMSSDPAMNWRIAELNNRAIVSFSDAHSFWPWRLGREATIFSKAETCKDVVEAIRRNDIEGTIETDPAYGKYHWDGHRNCGFSSSPEETKRLNGVCPKCRRPLTIGVENRVEKISNQPADRNPRRKPYHKILPLHELIAAVLQAPVASKKVWAAYSPLVEKFGNEFRVLLDADGSELRKALPGNSLLVETILENRAGGINVKPGYDGVYGSAVIAGKEVGGDSDEKTSGQPESASRKSAKGQRALADFR